MRVRSLIAYDIRIEASAPSWFGRPTLFGVGSQPIVIFAGRYDMAIPG